MALIVKDMLTDISVVDRRQEWQKVESEYSVLKKQFVQILGIDKSLDVTGITALFNKDAEDVFVDTQKQIPIELKDVPLTSGGVVWSSVFSGTDSNSSSSSSSNSTVRKEPVNLPRFCGSETNSPYLTFPTWLKQWNVLILEYDERYRTSMLRDHLDQTARSKFIGYEDDYEESMKRLSSYYGDPIKVIQCVLKEVMEPNDIHKGNNKGLIHYSLILENNYNRLSAMSLEHEMSNFFSNVINCEEVSTYRRREMDGSLVISESTAKTDTFPSVD